MAAAPVRAPTLLMAAQGQLDAIRATAEPRMANIVRAVDVPGAHQASPGSATTSTRSLGT